MNDRLLKIILVLITVFFILFISERNYKQNQILSDEAGAFENNKLTVSLKFPDWTHVGKILCLYCEKTVF